MKKRYKQRKKHWFLISYTVKNTSNETLLGSFWVNRNSNNITYKSLNFYDSHIFSLRNDLTGTPIITAISYLGHMTEKEFYDEPTK